MTLHKNCYNNLRLKIRVNVDTSSKSWSATNQKQIPYVKKCYVYFDVSNAWLCFFFYFVFSLDEWNIFFFLFWVTFRWINIGGLIVILDWFTPEMFVPPCLFVRNNDYAEKGACLSHFCFLVESFLPHCSCIIISPRSESFFIFCNNIDRHRPLWYK